MENIEERKKLGFNTFQRKYILRIEQYYLERETEYLKEISELKDALRKISLDRTKTK